MSLFGPPVLQRVSKASPVLEGGRTRLRVALSGWGRLTLEHASPDGAVVRRRMWFFGGERELSVDVMPPGEIAIDLRNPFGGDSTVLTVRADVAGVVELPAPQVQPLPEPPASVVSAPSGLPVHEVRLPDAPSSSTPRLRLGTITIKTIQTTGSAEGET
jgi:hypothetical protein